MPIAQNKQENGAYVEKCLPFTPVLHAEGQPGTGGWGPSRAVPSGRVSRRGTPGAAASRAG